MLGLPSLPSLPLPGRRRGDSPAAASSAVRRGLNGTAGRDVVSLRRGGDSCDGRAGGAKVPGPDEFELADEVICCCVDATAGLAFVEEIRSIVPLRDTGGGAGRGGEPKPPRSVALGSGAWC